MVRSSKQRSGRFATTFSFPFKFIKAGFGAEAFFFALML